MNIWKDEEVKKLFEKVEDCKKSNVSLKFAFSNHAKDFGRKPNSVRNYYYHEVDNLSGDKQRCERLAIDISKHKKAHFESFDQIGSEKLVENIESLTKSGMSVRSACFKLSAGNLVEMTRLQNKYQNLKRQKEKTNNIIKFKKKQTSLSENDINSLFMGLVRLIKKTAVEEVVEQTKMEKESSAFLLKKAFLDLNKKDKQIAELRKEFEDLKNENQALLLKINQNKRENLKKRLSQNRIEKSLEN